MKEIPLLTGVRLLPYSQKYLFVICGYSSEDLKEYINDNTQIFGKTDDVYSIKKTLAAKRELLDFIDRNAADIDSYNSLDSESHGIFIYNKAQAFWLMVLKKGFNPDAREDIFTLSHETTHLCQIFLPQYLNRDEELEAEAYFHNYVMREICRGFDDNK